MSPILKRPGEAGCLSPAKLSKSCNLRGSGSRQPRRAVGAVGPKSSVLQKPPPPPPEASQTEAVSSQISLTQLKEMLKKLSRYSKETTVEEAPKAKEGKVSRSTFTFTVFDDDSDDANSRVPVFKPELVTAHCFRWLKKKNFHLPQRRRRIIIVSGTKDQVPAHPKPLPQAPPPPIPSFKALDIEDIQEPPMDRKVWLKQRAELRSQVESFGDVKTWVKNKPRITPSEAKVLLMIRQEKQASKELKTLVSTPEVKIPSQKMLKAPGYLTSKFIRQHAPQLRLPKPPVLSDLYTYLRSRKLKILDVFNKGDRGENERIPREEFITSLKAIGVPLKNQELEDIVIYLGTLGKQNAITTDALLSTYKQWAQTQQRETVPTAREYYRLYIKKNSLKRISSDEQDVSYPQTPKMDLLKVPEVDTKMEGRPMTEEDMEDVGRRYRERRRKNKLCLSSIQYMERCRLVRSGVKAFDEHCLPSTLSGEMEELINVNRRNDFLLYLKCWEVCKAYKLPLTEDILMRALLYPGDKLITIKDQVRPIRQPGGYYLDQRLGRSMAEFGDRCHQNLGERKTDKKTSEKVKKMNFQEFQEFTWNLEKKGSSSISGPHPNNFWPGHLLDKLRLYLPSVAKDNNLAIFSYVEHGYHGHAYPARYQPRDWWPMRDNSYVTYAYHDAHKVYFLN